MLEKGHGKWPKARFGELKTDLCAMEIIYYELPKVRIKFTQLYILMMFATDFCQKKGYPHHQ